jgi:hypothetical protein
LQLLASGNGAESSYRWLRVSARVVSLVQVVVHPRLFRHLLDGIKKRAAVGGIPGLLDNLLDLVETSPIAADLMPRVAVAGGNIAAPESRVV